METAAEFAKRLETECVDGIRYEERFSPEDAVPLIEDRDNAVRLDLLQRLLSHAMPAYGIPVVTADVIRAYLDRYGDPR